MLMSMGRRTGLLLATVAAALVVFSGVALAVTYISCKAGVICWGTSVDDDMTGTNDYGDVEFGSWNDMRGLGGTDTLRALAGDDKLNGGPGTDTLDGGDGSDTYIFENGWGSDTISADSSGMYDVVDFSKLTTSVTIYMYSSNAQSALGDSLKWPSSVVIERYYGGSVKDYFYGYTRNDQFYGGGGDDYLSGSYGDDLLQGDYGNDTLVGGPGKDNLYGLSGSDTIRADDGTADGLIWCGPDNDTVYYDSSLDNPASDCESKIPR